MRSLRVRLLLLLGLAITLAGSVQFILSFNTSMAVANRLFDDQMRQIASSLHASKGGDLDSQANFQNNFDFVIQIWRADRVQVYEERPHRALPHQTASGFSNVTLSNGEWRVFAIRSETGLIQVAQKMKARQDEAIILAINILWPIALVSLFLLGAMWWVVTKAFKPLAHVQQQLNDRGVNSLEPVSIERVPSEVAPILAELNSLLSRVSHVVQSQQQFVADAAHELRSPLTALKLQMQMLKRASTPVEREGEVQALSGGIDRSIRLVEQLLVLAHQDAIANGGSELTEVKLSECVSEVLADVAIFATEKHVELSFLDGAVVTVTTDADGFRILLRNLLDNAIRYTPAYGAVTVSVLDLERSIDVTVCDSGPGIPETELQRVTDRFYRLPGATQRGSGLGLAIVKAIADRSGVELQIRNSSTGGLVVRARFHKETALVK